jgi:DNA repair exonuclease SbcCD ATPase subunit
MLKSSNMQSAMVSNRFIIGIVAFGVSFGLSLVLSWDFNQACLTGIITIPATYLAVLFVDKRRRNHEMLVLDSLHRKIRELEGLKSHLLTEVNQLQAHRSVLYAESNNLQHQVAERRNQRDTLNRELSTFFIEKQQLEAAIAYLQNELHELDKTKVELNNNFSALNAEKRRLDLNYNISRGEATQLQNQISELQGQKQELENNITLLNRLKPQLEEKLYELRSQIQELEVKGEQYNQLLLEQKTQKEDIETSLDNLQTKLKEKQKDLEQLQGNISLLQDERDQLQNQVWELLQQMETFTPELSGNDYAQEENGELFPFSDLIESFNASDNIADNPENFTKEWNDFLAHLPDYEIRVLQAILEQENPITAIKKIAEENITMPNLLIDSINERAKDIIGELIINTGSESPEIYQEHMTNVKKLVGIYENTMDRQTSRH